MSESTRPIWSVSELNRYASGILEKEPVLHDLTVRGEISGFKRHTSGHLYFTLKDVASSIKCVMFKGETYALDFRPLDGDRVTVSGYVSIYQQNGSFQLYISSMKKDGKGDLFARFMEMKAMYKDKGYFDIAYKKSIPYLPRAIGIVTSGSGAALQDIRQIIGRRFPTMPIYLCPVKVQGEGAAEEIARGIETVDKANVCDVIIVGRGGGSVEDLWAFNEVPVIEAIHACETPVISAVGHETDFSVSDFVADMRAPTPSAAAELSVPPLDDVLQTLDERFDRMQRAMANTLTGKRDKIELLKSKASFSTIRHHVQTERTTLTMRSEKMDRCVKEKFRLCRVSTEKLYSSLNALDPERVLERGYAIVSDSFGRAINGVHETKENEVLNIRFNNGSAETQVIKIIPKEN